MQDENTRSAFNELVQNKHRIINSEFFPGQEIYFSQGINSRKFPVTSNFLCIFLLVVIGMQKKTIVHRTLNARSTYPAEGAHLMFALFLHEDRYVHDDAADQYDVVDVR